MNKKTIYDNQTIIWKEQYKWEYNLNDIIQISQNNINNYLDDYGYIDVNISNFIKSAIWRCLKFSSASYNTKENFGRQQYNQIIRQVMPYIYYQQPLF